MRALQTAHEAAAIAAQAPVAGAGVLPTRHPAKLNGDRRRTDAYASPLSKLDNPEPAQAPPAAPPKLQRGRRATDRRPTAFPHPSQLKPQSPFMAQLMGQDQPAPAVAARLDVAAPASPVVAAKPPVRLAESDLVTAQRRHFEQVGAYRKTVTMATDFIIRRYHLAADFQGLMIGDSRAVEMLV